MIINKLIWGFSSQIVFKGLSISSINYNSLNIKRGAYACITMKWLKIIKYHYIHSRPPDYYSYNIPFIGEWFSLVKIEIMISAFINISNKKYGNELRACAEI